MKTSEPVPEAVLALLADDIAARTGSAHGSARFLYEATSPDLALLVRGWVTAEVVDDVLVETYAHAWRIAGLRPHELPVRSWLTAIALGCASRLRRDLRGQPQRQPATA